MQVLFLKRLGLLLRRRRFGKEFDEEMDFHREQAERAFIAGGMEPEAARYAAMRQFGNATRAREKSHEVVGFRFESVVQDARYALRQLASNPGFTAVITLTLALSIGANSAIFSVIEGVLLKPLPYPHSEQIVRLFLSSSEFPKFPLNPFDFRDFRARNKSFQSMAAFTRGDIQLSGSGEPLALSGFKITAGYFRVLGLTPELGREFDRNAEIPGNGRQVILSDRLWRTRFNAAPDIVGRKVTLNMQPYTVVGVMPAGTQHPGNDYHSLPYGESVDVWWPFEFTGNPAQRGSHYMEGIGRLKDGVTAEQADAEMNALMAQVSREHEGGGWNVLVIPLYREIVGANQRLLLVLLGAVGMVLLIACANAANLLLARAAARQREVAVRLALGAPRRRLIRQMLTESVLIALLGGGLGAALAKGGVKALVALLPPSFPRAHDIHVNALVFAFTLLVSIFTGFLFGLAPALQASRMDPKRGLYEGGRSSTGSARQQRLRSALVVSEVSLACVLLIGAGLMLRSFLNQLNLDPGFKQDHVLTAVLSLPQAEYKTSADNARFFARLMAALHRIPGVQYAGAGSDLPWTGYDENAGGFTIEGKQPPPHEQFHARYHMATPDYFRALGTRLVRGRFFTDADTNDAPKVVIINQAMASRYWPNENVIEKRFTFEDNPKDKDWLRIVGVVGDVKDKPNSLGAEPAFWWPHQQAPLSSEMSVVVRAGGDPRQLVDALRDQVKHLDPLLAIANVRLMDQVADESIATPRFSFFLVGLFAGLAIVLAAIGTYGVISYSVSQRIPEFGLRLALGAPPSGVQLMVLVQAMQLAVVGAVIGLAVALMLARVMSSMIYNVSPADPFTFVSVVTMVVAIALLACYLPARRAAKANPMVALRAD
jgi:predicted permease